MVGNKKINIPESFRKHKSVEFPTLQDVKRAIDCGQILVRTCNGYIILSDGNNEIIIGAVEE